MRNQRAIVAGVCLFAIVALAYSLLPSSDLQQVPSSSTEPQSAAVIRHYHPLPGRTDGGYATSEACISCHPTQHSSWHDSYHRTMTQWASAETILAHFADVPLATAGQTANLQRRGDEFWVNMVDPTWELARFEQWNRTRGTRAADPFESKDTPPRIDAQVVMTTGSHHFQAFWIRGNNGRELWQFPWRYHLSEQRWVHRKDVFLAPPEWRPGMWFRVWNNQCIFCHSTGPLPGLDPNSGVLAETKIAELGIACEACHGPGAQHIAFRQQTADQIQTDAIDPIINPAKLTHELSSQVCGSCHSHFEHQDPMLAVDGPQYRPGKKLFQYGSLETPPRKPQVMTRFWADGVNRSGGREFNGMSSSKCYQQGELACTSCHSMHESEPNDQLSQAGLSTEACLQCHEELRDNEQLSAHTHHTLGSSGSHCYNCHMPHTNYALYKGIRSHTINSPRVTSLTSNSRPNACNLCHLDQTLQWSADHLERWYDIEPPQLNEDDKAVAAGVLWSLKGDAGQRVIAAWHFGWKAARQASGDDWMVPTITELMKDPYAAVRWVAFDALRKYAAFVDTKFDFDIDLKARNKTADEILAGWLETRTTNSNSQKRQGQLLQMERGKPDRERTNSLLRQRDRRPVAGVE